MTAGNASGINDGAAARGGDDARRRPTELGLKPLARIASYASAGVDPSIMGMGPVPASQARLERAGWKAERPRPARDQRGLRRAGLRREPGRWAGTPARSTSTAARSRIGHPIGASGCRILVTLLHEMQRRDAKKGIASLCIGGGMGVALAVER